MATKRKDLLLLFALAVLPTAGMACFDFFARRDDAAKEATIQACAGLSGPARVDCEKRHQEP